MYTCMVGGRELAYFAGERSFETMAKLIEQGIEKQNKTMAMAGLTGLPEARVGGTKQAELILTLAKKYQQPLAERLTEVHLRAKSPLSNDSNFLGQAVWMLTGGVSPVADTIEPVLDAEVLELFDRAKERWKTPRPIPGWCCDGTHSAGNDVRFMGVSHEMYAVCKAFEYYGRIDPADEWLPQFQCYDGLIIQRGGSPDAQEIAIDCTGAGRGPATHQTTHSGAFPKVAGAQTNGLPSNPKGCI
jgi:hypothetical protein